MRARDNLHQAAIWEGARLLSHAINRIPDEMLSRNLVAFLRTPAFKSSGPLAISTQFQLVKTCLGSRVVASRAISLRPNVFQHRSAGSRLSTLTIPRREADGSATRRELFRETGLGLLVAGWTDREPGQVRFGADRSCERVNDGNVSARGGSNDPNLMESHRQCAGEIDAAQTTHFFPPSSLGPCAKEQSVPLFLVACDAYLSVQATSSFANLVGPPAGAKLALSAHRSPAKLKRRQVLGGGACIQAFFVSNVETSDARRFWVRVSWAEWRTKMPTSVPTAPHFLKKPVCAEAFEGDSVVLICEVEGNPAPTVIWERDFLNHGSNAAVMTYKTVPGFLGPGFNVQECCEPLAKVLVRQIELMLMRVRRSLKSYWVRNSSREPREFCDCIFSTCAGTRTASLRQDKQTSAGWRFAFRGLGSGEAAPVASPNPPVHASPSRSLIEILWRVHGEVWRVGIYGTVVCEVTVTNLAESTLSHSYLPDTDGFQSGSDSAGFMSPPRSGFDEADRRLSPSWYHFPASFK
ncbi:unnamed protein product [Notodromas monacha]|uniref:Ig-like domain-containing protein n=1 Tax=Notodromas monacha TaxID=399045 RepID=A0A7R9GAR2_9CRUS|nr:unnamed protein product [Notodromas monacha]CAG0914300.1 unnamed protein product [Notodromas monacha]